MTRLVSAGRQVHEGKSMETRESLPLSSSVAGFESPLGPVLQQRLRVQRKHETSVR